MGFKAGVKKLIKEKQREYAYDKAARKQIKKKADAAYYKAREKQAIKEAQARARKPKAARGAMVDQIFSGDVGFVNPHQSKGKKRKKANNNPFGW